MPEILTLILPACGRLDSLPDVLDCLLDPSISDRVRLIVPSNQASEEEREIVERAAKKASVDCLYLANPQNIGMCRSLYRAVLETRSRFVMFLSDDDYVDTATVEEVLAEVEREPTLGVIRHATWNESDDGEFVRSSFITETRQFAPGIEAASSAYLHCGQITGVAINLDYIDLKGWPLDETIYPQIRLGGICAFEGGYKYLVSEQGPRIPKNDTLGVRVSDEMGRPVDYGVLERVSVARELSQLSPESSDEFKARMMGSISSWASRRIFPMMYGWDKDHAMRYLKSLLDEEWLTERDDFWDGLLGCADLSEEDRRTIKRLRRPGKLSNLLRSR